MKNNNSRAIRITLEQHHLLKIGSRRRNITMSKFLEKLLDKILRSEEFRREWNIYRDELLPEIEL